MVNTMIMFLPLKHLSGRDLFLCEIEMNIKQMSMWIFFHFGKIATNKL